MELARGLHDFSIQLGIDVKLVLSPESVEDVCYSIFATFRSEGSIAVSKPACIRAVVYSPNFELRFFARPETGEAMVTLYTFHEDASRAREIVRKLCRVVNLFTKATRGFVEGFSDARMSVKIMTTVKRDVAHHVVEVVSRDFGASLRVSEFRDLDDSKIKVFSGFLTRSGSQCVSLRIVVIEKRSRYASLSITLETPLPSFPQSVEDAACSLVGLAKAIVDYSILSNLRF